MHVDAQTQILHVEGIQAEHTMFRMPDIAPSLFAGFILLFVAIILSHRYIASRDDLTRIGRQQDTGRNPPTEPYTLSLLGSFPFGYVFRPYAYVLDANHFFGRQHPVRVKILHFEFYVVQGAQNIKALFKNSGACTSLPFIKFALGYAFGLPAEALAVYDKDDSGGGHIPHADSTVEPRNRIDYRGHQSMIRFLEGPGLTPFWNRFAKDITARLHNLHSRFSIDWTACPDLMRLIEDEATCSIVNALCGPHLLRLSPTFLRDYWEFDRNLQTYLQGVPWFLAPKAYASRKRVLEAVRLWQQHARENFIDSAIQADGDDPFWGCSFFRERQRMFIEMDGFTHDAIVSEDFGAIWAARNAIATTSWVTFEIFRDPELLARVRGEVSLCRRRNDGSFHAAQFDIDQLLRQPVLQAVYAETLRLRMHFYIIRMSDKVDMKIQDWIIPRRKIIVTSTTAAHHDAERWNTGVNDEHPINKFWAGRFLKESKNAANETVTFSTKETEGSWIPYGGGPRQCPGRHFAKRQILLTTALMVTLFEFEIPGDGTDVKEDLSLRGFGGGMSKPAMKVPAKIRRRVVTSVRRC